MEGSGGSSADQPAAAGSSSGGDPVEDKRQAERAECEALASELPEASAALTAALGAYNVAMAAASAADQRIHTLQRELWALLPQATRVAQLLERWYQLPAQAEPLRLQLARAAGSRACAYLGCANLGGGGGPFAGEGEGSLRCSACKAVW